MNYFMVYLNSGGHVIREKQTQEIMNQHVGEFESREEAIDAVCEQLECAYIPHAALKKGEPTGGFLLCDVHEFVEL